MDIKQKTTETYDKIAQSYSAGHFALFSTEEFDFYKSLVDGKKVVDLGCGAGFISVKEKNGMDERMMDENKYGGISRYFSFYTQEEFKDILEQKGFQVVKMSLRIENDERKTSWLCYFVKTVK